MGALWCSRRLPGRVPQPPRTADARLRAAVVQEEVMNCCTPWVVGNLNDGPSCAQRKSEVVEDIIRGVHKKEGVEGIQTADGQ